MKNKSSEITLAFTGDVMLGRLMNDVMEQKGMRYVWGDLIDALKNSDLTLINLEFAITNSKDKWDAWPKTFHFKMLPKFKRILKSAGIDYASLANNHILDFKERGLLDTIKILNELKIKHTGAGKNLKHAKKPVILNIKKIKIGILSFQDNHEDWTATKNKPGTFYLEINEKGLEIMKREIKKLRSKVDILIVSAHWGPNMLEYPLKEHINFARSLIDEGVDIFHGHSSHVFQGIEKYKNRLIMYDTGEFVDDYAVDPFLRNDLSFLYLIKLNKRRLKELELIPIIIKNFRVNKAESEADMINDMMIKRSLLFKTRFVAKNKSLILKF